MDSSKNKSTIFSPALLLSILLGFVSMALFNCSSKKENQEDTAQLDAFIKEFTKGKSSDEDEPVTYDLSADYFKNELARTKEQLTALRKIDTSNLTGDNLIDWKFAHSILIGRELDQEKMVPWKKDPRMYMAFTRISTVIDKPGELKNKLEEIEERLTIVPQQVGNAEKQLEVYVPRFQELSVFMAENGKFLFDKELPAFIEKTGAEAEYLKPLVDTARKALEHYITFLKEELPKKPVGEFAVGEATYNAMLKGQYLLGYNAESLWDYGWERFNATVKELEELANKIEPGKDWQQLAREIKNEYPAADKMIEAHQQWVDKAGEHIKSKNIIPIPWPERVNVVPRAEYLRKTSYYGNFSSARGKDSEGIFTSEWMINPFEEQWDEQRKKEYLVEHDWGVIIVTAPHETYGGHHVQGLYQLHNPRPLRKTNGISIFSEGWGLYNEQLMHETDFFPNERIHLRQLQLRLWRNARVIYDVGMHTGRLSYEEAINLMVEKVGFLRWAAQLEVDSASERPGYFIGYFMGMSEILKMRAEYKALMGDRFTLSEFHEKLLKIGNMPPALMREALMMK